MPIDSFGNWFGDGPAGRAGTSKRSSDGVATDLDVNTLTVKRLKVGLPITTYPDTTPAADDSVIVGQQDGTTAWVAVADLPPPAQITAPGYNTSYVRMVADEMQVAYQGTTRMVINNSFTQLRSESDGVATLGGSGMDLYKAFRTFDDARDLLVSNPDQFFVAGPTDGPLNPNPETIDMDINGTRLKLNGAAAAKILTCTNVDGTCSWQTPSIAAKIASPNALNSVECTNANIVAAIDLPGSHAASIELIDAAVVGDVGGAVVLRAVVSGIEFSQVEVRRSTISHKVFSFITNTLIQREYISAVDHVWTHANGTRAFDLSINDGVKLEQKYAMPRTVPLDGQYIRATNIANGDGSRQTVWESRSFASHYYTNNNTAIALPAANTYVALGIARTTAATSADFISGVDGLQYTGATTKNFRVTASLSTISSGPQNETYRFKFSVAGSPTNAGSMSALLDNSNTYPTTVTLSSILPLSTGNKLDVVVANLVSGQDLLVIDFSLTATVI